MDDIGIFTYRSANQCDIGGLFEEPYIGCPYPCPPMRMGEIFQYTGCFMLNIEGEENVGVEYSAGELVQLVQDGEHVLDSMEVDPLIVDGSDDESKAMRLSHAQKHAKDVLNYMASLGSRIFNTLKLLRLDKSHDKLFKLGVTHLTSTKQCDIRSFFVSTVRSLPYFNVTF